MAWAAASSSIPQLRTARQRPALVEPPAIAAWEESEEDPASARSSVAAARRMDPVSQLARLRRYEFAALLKWVRQHPVILSIGTGAVVVIAFMVMTLMRPGEHFVSVATICANAHAMDGQLVHVHGTVGQTFLVGGGSAFYLHQGRDSVVVYTLLRSPAERQHIQLFGTVSTGFLDGKPRAAVFEAPAPSRN